MRNFYLLLLIIPLLFTSCISLSSDRLVYSICDYEITDSELNFTVKNTSQKNFSSFILYVEFASAGFSDYDTDVAVIEKTFESDLESGETDSFSIDLSEEIFLSEETVRSYDDGGLENSIYVQKIYISEIRFDDESVFCDRYGSWSF